MALATMDRAPANEQVNANTASQPQAENALDWAQGFLAYLGKPATSVRDPRLTFLEAMYNHEGDGGSNPLAITNAEGQPSTNLPGNSAGVKSFASVQSGYVALHRFLVNQHITGLLSELLNPATTTQDLTNALSQASWEGSSTPQARAASVAYANAVGSGAASLSGQTIQPLDTGGVSTGTTGTPTETTGSSATEPIQGMNTNYTGPGAYKGFDLQSVSPSLLAQAKAAIDEFTATPGAEQAMMTKIYQNYGDEAWAASIPELRTVLVMAAYMGWTGASGTAELQSAFQATNWWKQSSDNGRLWAETVANDPGQAQVAIQEAASRVTNIANSLGAQLSAAQLNSIATTVASQSVSGIGQFSNTQFTDQQIYQSVVGAINSPQFTNELTGTSTAGAGSPTVTGASAPVTATTSSGDAAALYNAFTTIARNYYLGWTPQQVAKAVQTALASDTGQGNFQSGAIASFTTQAQNLAKVQYPGLSSIIGTTSTAGTDNTPYAALAGYRSLIAQYTGYGSDPDTIDLTSPQWSWILSGATPPNNVANGITQQSSTAASSPSATANGQLPSYDTVQRYLMQSPQYQTTDQAKSQAWQVGKAITSAFGF
jgi:hypothetical protein